MWFTSVHRSGRWGAALPLSLPWRRRPMPPGVGLCCGRRDLRRMRRRGPCRRPSGPWGGLRHGFGMRFFPLPARPMQPELRLLLALPRQLPLPRRTVRTGPGFPGGGALQRLQRLHPERLHGRGLLHQRLPRCRLRRRASLRRGQLRAGWRFAWRTLHRRCAMREPSLRRGCRNPALHHALLRSLPCGPRMPCRGFRRAVLWGDPAPGGCAARLRMRRWRRGFRLRLGLRIASALGTPAPRSLLIPSRNPLRGALLCCPRFLPA